VVFLTLVGCLFFIAGFFTSPVIRDEARFAQATKAAW